MNRQKFATRTFWLRAPLQIDVLINLLRNVPLDAENPLQVVIREKPKVRTPDQNARMWAGPLHDLAEQAWVEGRQYSAEVWHEHAKQRFLPEDDDPELAKWVKDPQTWRKWDYTPSGARVCVGSTTQLTPAGMARHMEQIEALGAGLGVIFHHVER